MDGVGAIEAVDGVGAIEAIESTDVGDVGGTASASKDLRLNRSRAYYLNPERQSRA